MSNRDIPSQAQLQAEDRVGAFHAAGGPFVAAVQATRMPMVVTDPTVDEGNPIVYVNQSFVELFGYASEEVLGQNYFFPAGQNTDPEVETAIHAAMTADRPLNLEVLLYAKSGVRSLLRSRSTFLPIAIPTSLVEGLAQKSEDSFPEPPEFQKGQQIRITEGPFAAFLATVASQSDGEFIRVEADIFGRATPMDVLLQVVEVIR